MGANSSKSKYFLLYGISNSGKTLMQYYLQSSIKDTMEINPTAGFNFEELTINNTNLGIFDVSGDPKQTEILNIILKCVSISGIIFVIPIDKMEEIDKSKELLKLTLSNNYLKENLNLMIVYNYRNTKNKENLFWMTESILDNRIGLNKIKDQFKLENVQSIIVDISDLDNSDFMNFLNSFVTNLEKNTVS